MSCVFTETTAEAYVKYGAGRTLYGDRLGTQSAWIEDFKFTGVWKITNENYLSVEVEYEEVYIIPGDAKKFLFWEIHSESTFGKRMAKRFIREDCVRVTTTHTNVCNHED